MIPARLLYGAWLAAARPHHARFIRALNHPEAAQARLLARILADNADTVIGRRLGFDRIASVRDFRRRVPLVRYEDIEPDIDAIRAGESRVLTAEPVRRLVPSGGSSAAPKLIPHTRALGRDFARGVGAWMADLARRHPGIRGGPAYWSVSPAVEPPALSSAVAVGFEDDAAYLGRWLAPLVSGTLVAPAALRHARSLDAFRYATLRLLLGAGALRLISVWHPSFFELLWQARRTHWECLLADIHAGELRPPEPLDPAVQRTLDRGLRPDPRRAAELAALGPAAPCSAVWPQLEVVSAWGDAAARAPFQTLARRVAPAAAQPKGLLATEAFVSLPFAGQHPVALHSCFAELLDEDGRARGVHEAERGTTYEVVVTTAGGLYRYRLGDRVRVEGHVGATPSLRLVGRADRVVDRVGEKLSEDFVAGAIARVYGEEPTPGFAMLAPEGRGYALFVSRPPRDPRMLRARLDAELRESPGFAYARDLGQLGPTELMLVPADAAAAYLAHRHARGQALGAIKPAFLDAGEDWRAVLGGRALRGPVVATGTADVSCGSTHPGQS